MSEPQLDRLSRFLDARLTKLALVALVIVSLLPLDADTERALRPLFLSVFGAELVLRVVAWSRAWRTPGRPHRVLSSAMFGVVDLLAFVSFLPLDDVLGAALGGELQVLALLRLSRLLMLLRFVKELAVDIYTIMTRREQLQQFALVTGAVLVLSFVAAAVLSQLGADVAGNEGFADRLWWSFRQMESADNLVPHLRHRPIVIVISLLLTVTGVFIISFIIGIGTNVVDGVVRAERRRSLRYRDHTVVLGPVEHSEVLVREFVRIYAKNRQLSSPEDLWTWLRYASVLSGARQFPRVALLGTADEPPDYLVAPIMRWVVYRHGDAGEPESLQRVAAAAAKRAILLAHDDHHDADAVTVASLAAFRAQNQRAHVFVEVKSSSSVPIVEQIGGPGTFALDVPRTLGMFLCQHLITPGVERLYRDLLTCDGGATDRGERGGARSAEIYTHVFVDEEDQRGLAELVPQRALSFEALQRFALERHGVVLIGALLSDHPAQRKPRPRKSGLVDVEGLVAWLNPLTLPEPDDPARATLERLGAAPGQLPVATLRGLIGVADTYLPLRALATDVAAGKAHGAASSASSATPAEQARRILAGVSLPPLTPKRVVVIGYSDALPSLLRELSRYVAGVQVVLCLSARGDEATPLARRLEALDIGFHDDDPLPGTQGRAFALERGGEVRIYTHDGADLAGFAARALHAVPPVEAAVFMSEPAVRGAGADLGASDRERDARTAMRVLRFVRKVEDGTVPRSAGLHVLAEFLSVDKGAHVRDHVDARTCGFPDESCLRVTLVSTETIRNYFMVHSAFVPGVDAVYDTLLAERGQEIVRLHFDPPAELDVVTLRQVQRALATKGCIALAFERDDREVLLAPPADEPIEARRVRGVYVVADHPQLHRALG